MKSNFLVFVLLISCSVNALAQREISEDAPQWDFEERAYAGLGLSGLSFGTHSYYGQYFSIGVGALGGYMLTRNLSTGVGFEYQYTSYSSQKIKNHVYGGYPFVRYNIRNFFLQFDYNMLWIKSESPNASAESKDERFFAGIGFFNPGRGRIVTNFLISYDLLYTSSSAFGSPLNTRLFFTF